MVKTHSFLQPCPLHLMFLQGNAGPHNGRSQVTPCSSLLLRSTRVLAHNRLLPQITSFAERERERVLYSDWKGKARRGWRGRLGATLFQAAPGGLHNDARQAPHTACTQAQKQPHPAVLKRCRCQTIHRNLFLLLPSEFSSHETKVHKTKVFLITGESNKSRQINIALQLLSPETGVISSLLRLTQPANLLSFRCFP